MNSLKHLYLNDFIKEMKFYEEQRLPLKMVKLNDN